MTALDALVNEIRTTTQQHNSVNAKIREMSNEVNKLRGELDDLSMKNARLYDILRAYIEDGTDIVLNKLSGPASCYATNLPFSTSLASVI